MIIPVKQLGQVGLVTDLPQEELPLNAWTDARNVRFRLGLVEKFTGHSEIFPGVLWAPQWLLSASAGATAYWLYTSATKAGATDGATHADITRAVGGDYNMNISSGWTGTLIEDIPVINNGTDVPQMWNKPALNQRLQDLSNWPGDLRALALRSLKRYLIALDVTKAGIRYPNMIKWSHQAPTGNVPLSWDETDESVDTGEWMLPGEGGFIVDGCPLRDALMLYKEFEVWQMQYVGGIPIFRFSRVLGNVGALSRRCVTEFFSGKHLVFTGSDVVLHDGHQADSLVSEKLQSFITNNLDEVNYHKSFVATDTTNSEVWVCWPAKGQTQCTLALVWNWKRNSSGVRELPGASFIANDLVVPVDITETWDGAEGTWADDTAIWGDRSSDPTKKRLLMAVPGETKLYIPNSTQRFAGVNMVAYVERQGLGFPVKSDGPPDFTRMKQINKLWPHITGTEGGVVNVSLGVQAKLNKPPAYKTTRAFKIGQTEFLDFGGSEASRIHSLKFESNSDIQWKLSSYEADVIDRGMQ